MWQVFPKGHTSVSFPSGQSVLRLSFTVGFRGTLAASFFPLFFSACGKPVPARAYIGGDKGTGLFSTGQVIEFPATNRLPFSSDFWGPVEQRGPVLEGLSSSFVRCGLPLSARLHNTVCLPFRRRTNRPSSLIAFKTPATVSYRTSAVSRSSRVEIFGGDPLYRPGFGVHFRVTFLYAAIWDTLREQEGRSSKIGRSDGDYRVRRIV